MRGWLAALLLAGAPGGGAAPGHPAALSHLRIRVAPEALRLELTLQELTLRESPAWMLDQDADGRISTSELEDAWPEISAYLSATTWFTLGATRAAAQWSIADYEELGAATPGGGSRFERVVAAATLARPPGVAAIAIHSDLFIEEGNPDHRLIITVEGLYDQPLEWMLGYARRDWTVQIPGARQLLGSYLRLGFGHVLSGWDHLAFVAALLFGVAALGRLLGAVTAFTLAHSITLAISALGWFSLPPAFVEPSIACSVLLVLLAHLRSGPARARAWLPAFAFGLLHGFGFAGALGDIGLPREGRLLGLLGFNLGVEAGQLSFVLPLAGLAWAALRLWPQRWPVIRRTAALVLLAFAVHLVGAAVRAWWLPLRAVPAAAGIVLIGAGAAVLGAVLVTAAARRGGPPAERLRPLLSQAIVLAACYAAGTALAGPRL